MSCLRLPDMPADLGTDFGEFLRECERRGCDPVQSIERDSYPDGCQLVARALAAWAREGKEGRRIA